jgi:rubrerythrin
MVGASPNGGTRRGVLRWTAAGIVGSVAMRYVATPARAAPGLSAEQDRDILKFALTLEYVKASFYAEALEKDRLHGELRHFAEVAGGHEKEHVQALRKALGAHAQASPHITFGALTEDPRQFTSAAIALEETAVAAYNAHAANLRRHALAVALQIVSVEGRHAAWIRAVAGRAPAPRAADPGETVTQVLATLKRLHVR